MNSNNKNYKRKIWLNRITALLVLIILILVIVLVVKACSMRFKDKNNTDPTEYVAIITAIPGKTDTPDIETPFDPGTDEPSRTDVPEVTEAPGTEQTPVATDGPSKTDTPEVTKTPEKTNQPVNTPKPSPTKAPPTAPSGDYTEITILNAGDIMFHMAQVRGAYVEETDTYDFWPTYQYVAPIVKDADLAVVNFETTLYNEEYSGYPGFNSPASSLQAIKDAGFDTLLFANNHCYDKELVGVKRTLARFREYGFSYLGATDDLSKPKWLLLDVNGVKVGMINFSDSVTGKYGDQLTVNDLRVPDSDWDYLNLYVHEREGEYLYPRAQKEINELKAAGADIIIAYMHWGDEYELTANSNQTKAAQKLCDMGVDCIIGGHPHVVQGMDVLTSSDGSHETVCFYSLGNYVSNQNRLTLSSYEVKEYTENGLMVKLTIRKYNNGYTKVSHLEVIPTWVHRYNKGDGLYAHIIIPLPVSESDYDAYGLYNSSFGVEHSKQSYERTMPLFKDKIKAYNESH